jgi:hypothetical protein
MAAACTPSEDASFNTTMYRLAMDCSSLRGMGCASRDASGAPPQPVINNAATTPVRDFTPWFFTPAPLEKGAARRKIDAALT